MHLCTHSCGGHLYKKNIHTNIHTAISKQLTWCICAHRDRNELQVIKAEGRIQVSALKSIALDNRIVFDIKTHSSCVPESRQAHAVIHKPAYMSPFLHTTIL